MGEMPGVPRATWAATRGHVTRGAWWGVFHLPLDDWGFSLKWDVHDLVTLVAHDLA